MNTRSLSCALLVSFLVEPGAPATDASGPPTASANALLFDTKAGTVCGIKLGEQGSSALNQLPFFDEEQRQGVQAEFLKSISAQKYFLTPVPGVDDVKLGFSRFGGEFIEVQCTAKELKSAEGVGVGSTVGEFTAAFGNPVKTYPVGNRGMTGRIYHAGVMKIFAFSIGDEPNSVVTRMILQRGGR